MIIGAIIQARMTSTRLPGKVLLDLEGKPVLWHVVNRIKQAKKVDEVIIATTTDKADDPIVEFCKENKISYFRGSMDNVLQRYCKAAQKYKLDIIIRITSDCPVIDPLLIDEAINIFLSKKADYVSNKVQNTFPPGLDVEVFRLKDLLAIDKVAKEKYEREHVTPYFYTHPKKYKLIPIKFKKDISNLRLTLDTREDYKLMSEIYAQLYHKNNLFLNGDILKLFEKMPELQTINQSVRQKSFKESEK